MPSAKPAQRVPAEQDRDQAGRVAPDGRWLASGDDDGEVIIWNAQAGWAFRILNGHTSDVQVLTIAPDGTWLASADGASTVRIWDPATGQTGHCRSGSGMASVCGSAHGTADAGRLHQRLSARGRVSATAIVTSIPAVPATTNVSGALVASRSSPPPT